MADPITTPTYTFTEIGGRTLDQRTDWKQDQATRLFRGTCNGPRASNLPTWALLVTAGVNLGTPIPKRGDAHPLHTALAAADCSVSEDANSGAIDITITYTAPEGEKKEDEDKTVYIETARSWSSSEEAIDLKNDAETGEAVMLPTGHPFDSVPKTAVTCPVFSVTRKYKALPASVLAADGTVNAGAQSIDGASVPARCGKLTVSANRLYNDPDGYEYEATLTVTIKNNFVKLTGDGTATNIGHDKAIMLAGFFFMKDNKAVRAMEPDEETQELRPTAAPVLLKADGTLNTDKTKPVFKRIAALKGATWSSAWFSAKATA